jgi:hypothetical protein
MAIRNLFHNRSTGCEFCNTSLNYIFPLNVQSLSEKYFPFIPKKDFSNRNKLKRHPMKTK